MAGRSKEFDVSLIQRDPGREVRDREAMLSKMRGKLAGFAPSRQPAPAQAPRHVRLENGFRSPAPRGRAGRGAVWAGLLLLVAAVNWLLVDRKDTIMAKVGFSGIPSLPEPRRGLGADEKALYYAYALYDFAKFRDRYQVTEHYVIDQASARRSLQELIPKVSTATLGEISKYAPMGYMSVTAGRSR